MLVVGLMSGTSADGVDAAVVDVNRREGGVQVSTLAAITVPYPAELRADVLAACSPSQGTIDRICRLNALLGEWFARAALAAINAAGLQPSDVDLIASHGQTIYHAVQPGDDPPSTLQIAEPAVIAERTGRTVVANFRPRDVAAGGQGAPLISYVDYLLFADSRRSRALQNIGGIANVTAIPAGGRPDDVIAFDTGPGNMIIDALMGFLFDQPFDRDGRVAAGGKIDRQLLRELLEDPFFARLPPKTTGREQFGVAYAERLLATGRARGLSAADVVATATALTVHSIADAYRRFLPPVDEVVVSGGGAANPTLVDWLAHELAPAQIRRPEDFGISSDAKEAIGFAILGYETLHGRVGTLPRCTGARHAVVLGTIVPGENYLRLMQSLDDLPTPTRAARRKNRFAEVEDLVDQAVVDGVFPGAALVIGRGDDILLARGFGRLTTDPDAAPVDVDTLYDLASLTKVVATTTLAMILVDEGKLDLEAPVVRYLPAFGQNGKEHILIRDLLLHCSGLPAVFPGGFTAYATARRLPRDREAIVAEACACPLDYPTGTRAVYSDVGIIALGAALEVIAGERLDRLAARRIFEPLRMGATLFNPPPILWGRIAPTEHDVWRGQRIIRGEVHDECAWMMGGIAPHAGLFSTARDLSRFARMMLGGGELDGVRIVNAETVSRFVQRDGRVEGSTRALGWDTASPSNSAGPSLSPAAFGHTGFTGTSIWIDPARLLSVVLLSNRVYPTRSNQAIIGFRPRLHTAVVACLE